MSRLWLTAALVAVFIAGVVAGAALMTTQFAGAARELNCLHRAAEYPLNLSAKFAADVCAGEDVP